MYLIISMSKKTDDVYTKGRYATLDEAKSNFKYFQTHSDYPEGVHIVEEKAWNNGNYDFLE